MSESDPSIDARESSLAVVIPAYQAGPALLRAVDDAHEHTGGAVIVVVDGHDGTSPELVDVLTRRAWATVLMHDENRGKGAALKTGFSYVLKHLPRTMTILTVDADGQHTGDAIAAVASAGRSDPSRLVLGSRTLPRTAPFRSRVGNRVASFLFRWFLGLRLSDTQTGLRCVPTRLARASLSLQPNRFDFETAQLVTVRELGIPVVEQPIETVYLDRGRGSHFRPIRDSVRILGLIARHATVSASAATLDYVGFALLFTLGAPIVAANLVSRMLALTVQFGLMRSFVYGTRSGLKTFLAFVLYALVGGLVSGLAQDAALSIWQASPFVVKPAVELVLFFVNFIVLRDLFFWRTRTRR